MKYNRLIIFLFSLFLFTGLSAGNKTYLTLIPPDRITDKVDLDIRGGIVNAGTDTQRFHVRVFWDNERTEALVCDTVLDIPGGKSGTVRTMLSTTGRSGYHSVIMSVDDGDSVSTCKKEVEIIPSDIRSVRRISGAWAGIYHWSETEGKHWNKDIRKLTDSQWRELVGAMNKLDMNTIVVQEMFRNEEYVGKHNTTPDNYAGKAFYPSKLYPGRMNIAASDPLEAILSEADVRGMNVFVGVGMFAWFDFTPESLEWHKRVARELWDMYGHHDSFYGFYISEESGGGLDNWEKNDVMRKKRKGDIVNFFREMKAFCSDFAPSKPLMLATNSFEVPVGMDTYPELLRHLDILCPFGFARMPEGDLSGREAALLLQDACDKSGSHLWFDLEAFLFNPDNSLYPRPVDEIVHDLNLFDNFEKIICYQFPGVFNDPEMSVRVGEKRTVDLFKGYRKYLDNLEKEEKAASGVHPIRGTWINLAYKDVRNKYTNPSCLDNTDPELWKSKIADLAHMGMEYLVVMEVANEGKAFYPSSLMERCYDSAKKSPVETILDEAALHGQKVFLSTGWARNQDDDLRQPQIKKRQLEIMEEIASLYKDKKAFYGWYLPVEDCLSPVFPQHAVDAVNTLVGHAKRLTPDKKTLISPYGIYLSDFDDPRYEKQLGQVKVDIIAYQDEVGCVREPYPLPKLKKSWKRLRDMHDRNGIEMWANCELFSWEKATNDRQSALIPAPFPRILAQLAAASDGGVDKIVSFIVEGLVETPEARFQLGQPHWSQQLFKDYSAWKAGDKYWKYLEGSLTGKLVNNVPSGTVIVGGSANLADNKTAEIIPTDPAWIRFSEGLHEIVFDFGKPVRIDEVFIRSLNAEKSNIGPIGKAAVSFSQDGKAYTTAAMTGSREYPSNPHDGWVDGVLLEYLNGYARYMKVVFDEPHDILIDEVYINPTVNF